MNISMSNRSMQTLTLKRWLSSISILSLITLIVSFVLLLYGSDALKPYDAPIRLKSLLTGNIESGTVNTSVFQVRLPRILLALITGGALAAAGAGCQAILKNPLADPYVLGISSGAALGVIVSIYSGVFLSVAGISSTIVFAFIGAMLTLYIAFSSRTCEATTSPPIPIGFGSTFPAIIFAAI